MGESFPASPPEGLSIEAEIGSGAIATVVRVRDRTRGGEYAGKILHERHGRDRSANRRFVREAELASRLVHPNLVRVWGTRDIDGRLALLMELVEGPNLADALARSGPVAEPELLRISHGIASGLAYAHSAGVIHRDLKPANVLLAPGAPGLGTPKIADFGMARASSFAGADKGALTVLGTPAYMAPECLEPLAVDPRTDLYALGCMMFEMATGDPPFGGATPMAVLKAHRESPIPVLPAEFSETTRRLVRRLLAKAPGDRPQSAGAVSDAIQRATQGSPALAGAGPSEQRAEAAAEGSCAQCGEKVLRELRVCFACGLVQVIVEPGDATVFVTGPGASPNKFDTRLCERLIRWVGANAAAGLDGSRLQRQIPRLPFTLITGVSENCARTLHASLSCMGLEVGWQVGGRLSAPSMRKKTSALARRTAAVTAAVISAPMMAHPGALLVSGPLILAALPVVYGVTAHKTSRPYVARVAATSSRLPPPVLKAFAALPDVIAKIAERRHREALRAVVNRVVVLCREIKVDDPDRIELETEMVHAVNLAAGATLHIDKLDAVMAQPGFDPADANHRQSMHERDMWGARLLDLTSALDALVVRRGAAVAHKRAQENDLTGLRAMVEALEEVQRT